MRKKVGYSIKHGRSVASVSNGKEEHSNVQLRFKAKPGGDKIDLDGIKFFGGYGICYGFRDADCDAVLVVSIGVEVGCSSSSCFCC